MSEVDLNGAIRSLVASAVEEALSPYQGVLERMTQFMGPGAAAPRSAPAPVAAPARRRGRPARKTAGAANGAGDVSKFKEGQTVHYKQGRGAFEAVVKKVDAANGLLTLERGSDGKVVMRPAAKVY